MTWLRGVAVYADGGICLDILQNQWSPIYDVSAILTSIQVEGPSFCSSGGICLDNSTLDFALDVDVLREKPLGSCVSTRRVPLRRSSEASNNKTSQTSLSFKGRCSNSLHIGKVMSSGVAFSLAWCAPTTCLPFDLRLLPCMESEG